MDFILLGGDLFHVNRPSATVEHKCIKILRRHMNANTDRPTSFRRIEGQFSHCNKVNHANFEDPNLKVSVPIMTIHGNHDDPTGPQARSVCEKLATSGLLNYFGAINDKELKRITIEPIILEKGPVRLALYGLGFIPDYKLKLAFERSDVIFVEPPADTFNVLVVHQNRVPLNKCKFIADDEFPKFFHLIIRGHEHAAQVPEPIPGSLVAGMVYQPGSTVATSISVFESAPKKVGVVTVRVVRPDGNRSNRFDANYELFDIKSCRSIILKDISQKELFKHVKQSHGTTRITAAAFKRYSREFVEKKCDELLSKFVQDLEPTLGDKSDHRQIPRPDLPLLRIRLEYTTKNERFDETELNAQFYPARAANKNIVMFKKQKITKTNGGQLENITFNDDHDEDDFEDDFEYINLGDEKRDTIDIMIENYFQDKPADQRLLALSLTEYTNAVRGSSEDGNVISKVLSLKKHQVLSEFKKLVSDQEIAEHYDDEDTVKEWFLEAFANS